MPHPIIWFEVMGRDSGALSRFYGDLFGWRMDPGPDGYYMATPEGSEMPAGGVGADPTGGGGHVTFYAEADDLEGMLDEAERLGGKIVMPPTEPMEGTTVALFADPEGHVVGLVKPGPPPAG